MQTATLNYQYNSKENVNGSSRTKLHHRHVLTTVANPQKRRKQRQSLYSDLSQYSNAPLPPIKPINKRPSSIRIKGSSLTSSKIANISTYSANRQPRSHSQQSIKSEISIARSRSVRLKTKVSPGGALRSSSRLVRLKFGYPIKLRSAEFYGPSKSQPELRLREESFVNDSIRSAHQSRRSSIIPHYEPLNDPHLRQFFQSAAVLDAVRKALSIDANNSYKRDDRLNKSSKWTKRSKTKDSRNYLNDDFHRLVTKGSSGYGKLNGYDCIPSYSPARHRCPGTNEPTRLSSKHWNTVESHLQHSTTQDKYQTSIDSSFTSYPIDNGNLLKKDKKKSNRYEKVKQPKPIAMSSPLRHTAEQTTLNIEDSSATKTHLSVPEQKSEITGPSSVSQD